MSWYIYKRKKGKRIPYIQTFQNSTHPSHHPTIPPRQETLFPPSPRPLPILLHHCQPPLTALRKLTTATLKRLLLHHPLRRPLPPPPLHPMPQELPQHTLIHRKR